MCKKRNRVTPVGKQLTLSIALMIAFFSSVQATTYYVNPGGYDANDGLSTGTAWKTLAHALGQVKPNNGDVLVLSAGNFPIATQASIPAGLTISGAGAQSTIISCQYYYNPLAAANLIHCSNSSDVSFIPHAEQAQFLINGDNISFGGLAFDGNNKQCNGAFFIQGNHINFNNTSISNFHVFGTWVEKGDYVEIQHSTFLANGYGDNHWDFGSIIFWRVNHFYVHDNNISEAGTGCYGLKEFSNKILPCYYYVSLPEKSETNLDVNIYNNVINVDASGTFLGGSQPAIAIEVQAGIHCQAEIYNNWLNNLISLPIGSQINAVPYSYHVHHNYYDMTRRYGYALEASSSNMEFDHNIVLGGDYPLAEWGSYAMPLANFSVHHNVFYGPVHHQFFQQQQGYNGYKFYNNTVIDTTGASPIFSLDSGASSCNNNFEMKNNIFMSTFGPRGDIIFSSSCAAASHVNNNLFFNYTPKGSSYITQNPGLALSGNIPGPFFTLPAGSPAIDTGVVIPGITDGYSGKAPDLGAYEYAVTPWVAGVNATNIIPRDNTPPTVPEGITLTNVKGTSGTVTWNASFDNVGVDGYEIQLNNVAVGTTASNSLELGGLLPGTKYTLAVRARDKVYNWSPLSQSVGFTTFSGSREVMLQAENFTSMSGITNFGNGIIGSCDNGDWVAFQNVPISQYKTFAAYLASTSSGNVELRIDSLKGTLIGNLFIKSTGGFSTFKVENTGLDTCSGLHDLYFVFRGGFGVGNFDWFKLIGNSNDTISPSVPAGLKGYSKSSTALGLTWTPSTDNVSVAYYGLLGNGIATATTQKDSILLSGLQPGTAYSFSVRTYDSAGNVSAPGNLLNDTTSTLPDSVRLEAEAYTQMSGLATSSTGIGSADNGDWESFAGVDLGKGFNTLVASFASPHSGSHIELHLDSLTGVKIGDLTTTATGSDYSIFQSQQVVLSPNSGVHDLFVIYKVGFGIGNFDWFTLKNNPDTTPPSIPTGLTPSITNATSVKFGWQPSLDNYGVANYQVFISDSLVGVTIDTSFTVRGLTELNGYKFTVKAVDRYGNVSAKSTELLLKTNNSILLQAESYDNMQGVTKSSTGIGSADNGDWVGFNQVDFGTGMNQLFTNVATPNTGGSVELHLDGLNGSIMAKLLISPSGSFSLFTQDSIVMNGISGIHDVYIVFRGGYGVGNFDWFKFANLVDTTAPTIPAGFMSTSHGNSIDLSWAPSSDSSGVSSYEVFEDGNSLGATTSPSITVNNLSPSTGYKFTANAKDVYGNISVASAPFTAFTSPGLLLQAELNTSADPNIVLTNAGTAIDSCGNGRWVSFKAVNFNTSLTRFGVNIATPDSLNHIELHIDSLSGIKLADVVTAPTGTGFTAFNQESAGLTPVAGSHDVYIVFKSAALASTVGKIDWFRVYNGSSDTVPPQPPLFIFINNVASTSVALSWANGFGGSNYGIAGNIVYKNGDSAIAVSQSNGVLTGLTPRTDYTLTIRSIDTAGNISVQSTPYKITTSYDPLQVTMQAENADTASGATTDSDTTRSGTQNIFTEQFDSIDFGTGFKYLSARAAASCSAGTIEVYADSLDGQKLGVVNIQPTGSNTSFYQNDTVLINTVTGVHNVYVVFKGTNNTGSFDWFRLSKVAGPFSQPDTIAPSIPALKTVFARSGGTSADVIPLWTASYDNVGVKWYVVSVNNNVVATTYKTQFTISNLLPSTTYTINITAVDYAGNYSPASFMTITTPASPGGPSGATAAQVPLNADALTLVDSAATRLYPNPLKRGGALTIDLASRENFNATVQLVDINGRMLNSSVRAISKGNNTIRVGINHNCAAGIYMLVIRSSGKIRVMKKILIE